MLNRIQRRNRNRRPKSEEAVSSVDWQMGYVPTGGFVWVEGQTGPRAARARFLLPQATTRSLQQIPNDAFLQFAKLPSTPAAALEFANRYGDLGVIKRHFHSADTPVQFGECLSDWLSEIQQLRTCLEGWFLAAEDNREELVRFLRRHDWRIHVRSDGPWLTAQCRILDQINEKLNPQRVLPVPCFLKTCRADSITKLTPFVGYGLGFRVRHGQPTERHNAIESRLIPNALLSAIWLQFAELVGGSRVLRKCEKCNEWMDITESSRPGAKRMHERCSLRLRMARYRRKKNSKAK